MTCNGGPNPLVKVSTKVATVTAGSQITLQWGHTLDIDFNTGMIIDPSHNGPVMVYMAKVSSATGTPPNSGWFKIYEDGYSGGQWAVARLIANKGKVTVTIPSCIAAGDYVGAAKFRYNVLYRNITNLAHSSSVVNSSPSTLPAPTPAPNCTWSVLNSVSRAAAAPTQPPTTSPVSTPAPTPGSNSTSTPAPSHTPSPGPVHSAAAVEAHRPNLHNRVLPLAQPLRLPHLPPVALLSSGASAAVSVSPVLLRVLVGSPALKSTTTTVSSRAGGVFFCGMCSHAD